VTKKLLYPHVPKKREPLFPHVPKAKTGMPAVVETVKPKELWQMTTEEFIAEARGRPQFKTYTKIYPDWEERILRERRRIIERALSEGKPVSPEVLKDYPELA